MDGWAAAGALFGLGLLWGFVWAIAWEDKVKPLWAFRMHYGGMAIFTFPLVVRLFVVAFFS